MHGLPVLNRGFGGSQFSDLIDFVPRIVRRARALGEPVVEAA